MVRRGRPPRAPGADGAARTLTPDEEIDLALRVARMSYLEDRSKVDIAEELGMTRHQVARLLAFARENGMVHIRVTAPGGVDDDLSSLLADRLGISSALVLTPRATGTALDDIGRALADDLASTVAEGDAVGLTWSRATIAMTRQLTRLPYCRLVQLGGHVEGARGMPDSYDLLRRASRASNGPAYPIFAPLIVADAHTAATLRRQPSIAAALALHDELDTAVVSIGSWGEGGSTILETLPADLRQRARDEGVVGEVGGRMFDAGGRALKGLLDDRIIGATLDQIASAGRVVTTSYGAHRADATIAAARGGLVTSLIADDALARAVLERI